MDIRYPQIRALPNPKTVVIAGSSGGAGKGASGYIADSWPGNASSPPTSYAGLFQSGLQAADPTWRVFNVSISGTGSTTTVQRFGTDVEPFRPSHFVHCTGFGNEPLYATDPVAAAQVYLDNVRTLYARCSAMGTQFIQVSIYPRNDMTADGYKAALDANAQMEQMGFPVIDFMSSLDDGTGHFYGGNTYIADPLHLNDLGQAVLYDAIDLRIFTGGGFRQSAPEIGGGAWQMPSTGNTGIVLTPSRPMKAFAMRAKLIGNANMPSGAAALCAYIYGNTNTPLRLRYTGAVWQLADNGNTIGINSSFNPGGASADVTKHDIGFNYNPVTQLASLFIDGALIGTATPTQAAIVAASLLSFGYRPDAGFPASYLSLADLCVWRVPTPLHKFTSLARTGRVPSGSLIAHLPLNHAPRALVANLAPGGIMPKIGNTSVAMNEVAAF